MWGGGIRNLTHGPLVLEVMTLSLHFMILLLIALSKITLKSNEQAILWGSQTYASVSTGNGAMLLTEYVYMV